MREWEGDWEWRTERKGRSESEERETNRGGGIEGGRESEREKRGGEKMYYGRLLKLLHYCIPYTHKKLDNAV